MTEFYKTEDVLAVPTNEIARWGARIDRVNYALSQEISTLRGGGMADDGQVLDVLGHKAIKGEDWQNDPDYESAILYELKPKLNYLSVTETAWGDEQDLSLYSKTMKAGMTIGRIACKEGLARVGLLVPAESPKLDVTVPLGAIAALCHERADIKEELDRGLYSRHADIVVAQDEILTDVKPCLLYDQASNSQMSVYRALSYPDEALQQHFGGGTHREVWWRELQGDLQEIDHVSTTLG